MIGRISCASIAVLALALAACGSTVNDDDPGTAGAGASTGNGTSSTGGVGGSGTTGPGSTGSGAACAGYEDEPSAAGEVTLRVVNLTPDDIFLPHDCAPQFRVVGEDGIDWHQDLICALSCEELQTSPPIACGACLPSLVRVPANGSAELVWKATGLAQTEMPDSCWFEGSAQGECPRVVAAPAQTYRLEVPAYNQCLDLEGNPCVCEGDTCQGAEPTGFEGYHEPAQLAYPGANTIDVVFETCAFGCPSDDERAPQPGLEP